MIRRGATRLAVLAVAMSATACGGGDGAAEADAASADASAPGVERIDSLARIARDAGGRVGIAALHVESGRRVEWNADRRFPMASTYKLPIALAVLAKVDSGVVSLDDRIGLEPSDYRLGPDPVARELGPSGGLVTVRRLLEAMLVDSDNTAADALLSRVTRGTAGVMAHLRARGVDEIRVDRTEGQMHWDVAGVARPPAEAEWTPETFRRVRATVPRAARDSAQEAFYRDPRDTATPRGMAALLAQVARGEGMKPETHAFLLEAMEGSRPGAERLKGLLPEGTAVAHKTGTIGRVTNDAGIITLPDGTHVALAVFVSESRLPTDRAERIIARAARAVYAHFAGAPVER